MTTSETIMDVCRIGATFLTPAHFEGFLQFLQGGKKTAVVTEASTLNTALTALLIVFARWRQPYIMSGIGLV